jgi:tetratricopeptide (TPR) repeat protein
MTNFTALEIPAKNIKDLPLMHPGRPVGRDNLIKEIYTHLQSQRSVLLYGASGNGKTAVVAALAAAFVQQAGGVIWLTTGTDALPSILVRLGRGLAIRDVISSEQPAAHIGAVATALMQQKPLIVLDNVTDALALQQLIEKVADNIPLILISETDLEGPWESIAIEALGDMDSVLLFKQKSGISGNEHDINLYGLTKLLQYKPLALVLAARGMVAAKQTPEIYLKNLKIVQGQIHDPIMSTIALSYRSLNNALQGLVLMLGATLRGEASLDFISVVSGVPQEGIKQAMTILSQLYLVESFELAGKPYYRLHEQVYEFAQAALQGKNQLAALQKKVHDTSLTYARQNSNNPQNLAKEMDSFIAAALWASKQGIRETANQLVSILTDADNFVKDAGYVYELLTLRNVGSGSTSAFPAYPPDVIELLDDESDIDDSYDDFDDDYEDDYDDDYEDESVLDYAPVAADDAFEKPNLGDISIREGMNSEALRTDALQGIDLDQLRQALAQAKQQGDHPRVIQILKAIGKVQIGQDKETEAIATYNEILEAYETLSEEDGILDALNMLTALLAKTGNSQAAVMHATRGIQLARDLKDVVIELQLQLTLGDARQDLGETQAAVDSFLNALKTARTTGDSQNEAIALYKLGYAHLDNGDIDEAIHSLEQARILFKEQGKRSHEGYVLGGLGSANTELERWSEAIGYYQSALHIAREVQNKEEERLQLSALSQAQEQAGKLPDALLSYRQTLHLAYESEDREEIVSAIVDLVRLLLISPLHLDICDMLLRDALNRDAEDKDVLELVQQVNSKKIHAALEDREQRPVIGTAQTYAANAYQLLEQ